MRKTMVLLAVLIAAKCCFAQSSGVEKLDQ